MKHIKGDLIKLFKEGQFDVIVHGCNCGNNMGDGIAKTIRDEFPEAYAADLATVEWDHDKLGTYSQAMTPYGVIINAYTQFKWYGRGPDGPLCEDWAVASVFHNLKNEYGDQGKRFGFPAIGCARAGGDWNVISALINQELTDEDKTFVEYDGFDPRGNYKRNMGRK